MGGSSKYSSANRKRSSHV